MYVYYDYNRGYRISHLIWTNPSTTVYNPITTHTCQPVLNLAQKRKRSRSHDIIHNKVIENVLVYNHIIF